MSRYLDDVRFCLVFKNFNCHRDSFRLFTLPSMLRMGIQVNDSIIWVSVVAISWYSDCQLHVLMFMSQSLQSCQVVE